eukprot:315886-Hanusia_phi.AAC.4
MSINLRPCHGITAQLSPAHLLLCSLPSLRQCDLRTFGSPTTMLLGHPPPPHLKGKEREGERGEGGGREAGQEAGRNV